MIRKQFQVLLFVSACVLMEVPIFGQGISTGTLGGTLQDTQEAVVAGAKITAIQDGTNVASTASTNALGIFQVGGLPVGTYKVSVDASGFRRLTVNDVLINANSLTSLGTRVLEVGGNDQTIEVEAAASLLQTDPMQASQTFEARELTDLPIGNGFDALALLVPGVVPSGDMAFSDSNGATFSVNGSRGRDNNFQIDGQNNNDTSVGGPVFFFGNQDAIAEVQILTNYSAEYGRNSGSIANYITKSGTNSFHGSVFEFYNGDWADSLTNEEKSPLFGFCLPGMAKGTKTLYAGAGCAVPVVPRYVDNRFGGTLGGPIAKDKLWFFASANFERQPGSATNSSSAGAVTPDATGLAQLQAAFPGNAAVAALNAFGPLSVKTGALSFGAPQIQTVTGPGGVKVPIEFATFVRNLASLYSDNEATSRIDWQATHRDHVFGRYVFQQTHHTNETFGGSAAAGQFVNTVGRNQELGLDYARTISTRVLNQARFSYLRENSAFEGGAYPNCTRASYAQCPADITFYDGVDSGFGESNKFPQGRFVIDYQAQDNVSVQQGRHFFKFGGEFDRQQQPNFGLLDINGEYFFSNFSNFLQNAGSGTFLSLAEGPPNINFRENQFAGYFQDDWRPFDNLTVSLGLRYDLYGQALNILHNLTVSRESNPATAIWNTALPTSVRTVPSLPVQKTNFAPVLGFAYFPKASGWFSRHQTVIRGGFRMMYDPEFYEIFQDVASTAPSVTFVTESSCANCLPATATGGAVQQLAAANGLLPAASNPGLQFQEVVSPNFHNPYVEQWSFGVQQEVGPNIVAEARYVGNHAVGMFQNYDANPALKSLITAGFGNLIPNGLTPCATPGTPGFASGYANCNATKVVGVGNTGYSSFNALESRLNIRDWRGLTGGVAYTFSKTIDNTSEIFSDDAGGNTVDYSQNPFDLTKGERGLSGIDYPHDLSVYMLYELPFVPSQRRIWEKLAGGWELAPVYRYTSGQPYTVSEYYEGVGGSLCDPTGFYGVSSGNDTCRPILSNPAAPFTSVGICTNASLPDCGISMLVQSFSAGARTTMNAVRWIVNDPNAAAFFHTPFAGAGRNLARGDSINQVNLTVLKNFKVNERWTFQLRSTADNLMNRDFRGNPGNDSRFSGSFVNAGAFNPATGSGTFGNTYFNHTGGGQPWAVTLGDAQRRIEVAAKILF